MIDAQPAIRARRGRPARAIPGAVPDAVAMGLAWTALLLGLLVPLVVVLPVGSFVKIIAMIAFVCCGPGAAVLCWTRLGDAAAAWTVALILSLSLYSAVAVAMVWSSLWYPRVGLLVLALPTAASGALTIARAYGWAAGRPSPPSGDGPPDAGQPPAPRAPAPIDSTVVLPAYVDQRPMPVTGRRPEDLTSTVVMPAVPADRGDMTIPMAANGSRPDETALLPVAGRPLHRAGRFGLDTGAADAPRRTSPPWFTRQNVTHLILIACAVGLWTESLTRAHAERANDYGLLSVVPWTFFAAFVLCAVGFVSEIARGAGRRWALLGYTVIVLLMLHATVPIVLHEPEYAWTYKHVAVIQYLQAMGAVRDSHEIYQQWPTFFAAVASMVSTAGASPLRLSAWAPLFFDAANCLPVFAIARTLSRDPRMPYLSVFVFTCANWATQDYLSPQAFAFLLALGCTLILLRWVRRVPGTTERIRPRIVGKIWGFVSEGMPVVPYTSRRTVHLALAVLYVVYTVICSAHQLTPYMIALGAMGLVFLGLLSTWRVVPILLGIALMYLIPRQNFVDTYGIFTSFNIFKNASGNASGGWATAGQAFSAEVVRTLSLGMWFFALLAVLLYRRRLGPVAVPATLAFAPFALLAAQSYGGEAIYRVFLFSIPWCSYLASLLFLQVRRIPRWVGVVVGSLALTAAPLASIQGMHGQLAVNQFSTAEVRASQYIYSHAPAGSAIVLAAINFPGPLGARYDEFVPRNDAVADLVAGAELAHKPLTPDDLPAIDDYVKAQHGTESFLVISKAMRAYTHFFGHLPDDALDNLEHTLAEAPEWAVYYRNSDVVIYRFTG